VNGSSLQDMFFSPKELKALLGFVKIALCLLN